MLRWVSALARQKTAAAAAADGKTSVRRPLASCGGSGGGERTFYTSGHFDVNAATVRLQRDSTILKLFNLLHGKL